MVGSRVVQTHGGDGSSRGWFVHCGLYVKVHVIVQLIH